MLSLMLLRLLLSSPVTESLLSGWVGFGYNEGDVNKDTKVVLDYKFFKVNPSVLDPIFGVAAMIS